LGTVFASHVSSFQGLKRREMEEVFPMNRVLCSILQSGLLVSCLGCGAQAFAQEPGFPPETSAPPPKQGPSGSHHGMMDPDTYHNVV
jgi:hypothetical protein